MFTFWQICTTWITFYIKERAKILSHKERLFFVNSKQIYVFISHHCK